jgi:hypothetical protein
LPSSDLVRRPTLPTLAHRSVSPPPRKPLPLQRIRRGCRDSAPNRPRGVGASVGRRWRPSSAAPGWQVSEVSDVGRGSAGPRRVECGEARVTQNGPQPSLDRRRAPRYLVTQIWFPETALHGRRAGRWLDRPRRN